ncbi:MAG TPA: DUF4296 domain-containing protein [Puia sp.]|nr:DUF4296 domain-containing protein [Puia sp.]
MKRLPEIFILVLLTACSNRSSIPPDIIPLDSMTVIMKDVIIANEYAITYIPKDSTKKDKILANQGLLDGVFKIHHITRESFENSYRFYESRPDMNKTIFDSLSAYANRHRTDLYRPLKIQKPLPRAAQ